MNRSKFLLAVILWLALPVIGHSETYAQQVAEFNASASFACMGAAETVLEYGFFDLEHYLHPSETERTDTPYFRIPLAIVGGMVTGAFLEAASGTSPRPENVWKRGYETAIGAGVVACSFTLHDSWFSGSVKPDGWKQAHAHAPIPIGDLTPKQQADLVDHIETLDARLKP